MFSAPKAFGRSRRPDSGPHLGRRQVQAGLCGAGPTYEIRQVHRVGGARAPCMTRPNRVRPPRPETWAGTDSWTSDRPVLGPIAVCRRFGHTSIWPSATASNAPRRIWVGGGNGAIISEIGVATPGGAVRRGPGPRATGGTGTPTPTGVGPGQRMVGDQPMGRSTSAQFPAFPSFFFFFLSAHHVVSSLHPWAGI